MDSQDKTNWNIRACCLNHRKSLAKLTLRLFSVQNSPCRFEETLRPYLKDSAVTILLWWHSEIFQVVSPLSLWSQVALWFCVFVVAFWVPHLISKEGVESLCNPISCPSAKKEKLFWTLSSEAKDAHNLLCKHFQQQLNICMASSQGPQNFLLLTTWAWQSLPLLGPTQATCIGPVLSQICHEAHSHQHENHWANISVQKVTCAFELKMGLCFRMTHRGGCTLPQLFESPPPTHQVY